MNLNQELLTKFTYMCRERTIQINGSYLFESGDNIDNYLKAVGCPATNVESSLKSYKIEVSFLNETFGTKEWMNGQAISNSMKLDVETPIRYPDDKEGHKSNQKFGEGGRGRGALQICEKSQDAMVVTVSKHFFLQKNPNFLLKSVQRELTVSVALKR